MAAHIKEGDWRKLKVAVGEPAGGWFRPTKEMKKRWQANASVADLKLTRSPR